MGAVMSAKRFAATVMRSCIQDEKLVAASVFWVAWLMLNISCLLIYSRIDVLLLITSSLVTSMYFITDYQECKLFSEAYELACANTSQARLLTFHILH